MPNRQKCPQRVLLSAHGKQLVLGVHRVDQVIFRDLDVFRLDLPRELRAIPLHRIGGIDRTNLCKKNSQRTRAQHGVEHMSHQVAPR